MTSPSVGLREVASSVGVTMATVSMVLRGKPGISEATRSKVLEAAARLGYEPHVAAQLLARRRRRQGNDRLAVAYLFGEDYERDAMLEYSEGMGLTLHPHHWREFETPAAASRILWNRGIEGLIVSTQKVPWSLEERQQFAWHRFSVVKMGRPFPDLAFHIVRHSPFDYMHLALSKVVARGYRRVVVLLTNNSGALLDDNARHGALLNFKQRLLPKGVRISMRSVAQNDYAMSIKALHPWLKRQKPDAFLLYHWSWVDALQEMGYRFPDDIGVAAVLTSDARTPGTPRVTGCAEERRQHHQRSLLLLQELIARREKGFADPPMELVIEPVWEEGETLPNMTS